MPLFPKGVVAAGNPYTAEAGAEALRIGGNAVDAAIAAKLTAFIAEPLFTSPAGGGYLLLAGPSLAPQLINGFSWMPGRKVNGSKLDFSDVPIDFGDTSQTFHIGAASVAPPTLMAMLFQAHNTYGKVPIRHLSQSAIELAKDGWIINAQQAYFFGLLQNILSYTDTAKALFLAKENPLQEGNTFANPELGNILEMLCLDGVNEMYFGDLARTIVGSVQDEGLLRLEDMQSIPEKIKSETPLNTTLSSCTLLSNPPPTSGGILLSLASVLLDRIKDINESSQEKLLKVLAIIDREKNTAFMHSLHKETWKNILAPENLDDIQYQIKHHTLDFQAETRLGSTTHISIVDKDGMAVSITSSNGEGSGIVPENTGMHLNNFLGEADINPFGFHAAPPMQALPSMMAPTLLIQDHMPRLVCGSAGSNRISSALTQIIQQTMQGTPIEEAINLPRMHVHHGTIHLENQLSLDHDVSRWTDKGFSIQNWKSSSVYFGGVQAVAIDAQGLHAQADFRRGGAIAWE